MSVSVYNNVKSRVQYFLRKWLPYQLTSSNAVDRFSGFCQFQLLLKSVMLPQPVPEGLVLAAG